MRDSTDIEDGGSAKIPLNRRIAPIRDYRFTLTKHWTLHDAMLYSPYVATRLQTWREKGRRNLELLLAKMGCSLAQCRQHYGHMRPSIKDNLGTKLEAYAPSYNLPDLQFDSFQLEQGFKRAFSASDAVYAVSALLEAQHAPDEVRTHFSCHIDDASRRT
jgi:cell division control protein 45